MAVASSPAAAAEDWFAESPDSAGIDFVHFNGMSGELYFSEMMGAGVALLDYDGDGDQDVYLIQGAMLGEGRTVEQASVAPRHPLPLTDRLYRNDTRLDAAGRPTLHFVDVTGSAAIEASGYGMGVATGDVDGDGWIDLYLTNLGPNQLLRNTGTGTFEDATEASGLSESRWSVPASFVDVDADGRLDLFVGNYADYRVDDPPRCSSSTGAPQYCGPLAYPPESDRLWRNIGGGRFEDVSATSGITAHYGAALGSVAADFDGDGRMDLYVANDLTPNQLWINRGGGTFSEEALLAGCAVNWEGKPEASMGVHADDFDGDGDLDLFMTHLLSQTNTLYINDGRGVFRDATRESGLASSSWSHTGFGIASFDYDNDGALDLFVANGAVRTIQALVDAGDPFPLHEPNQLFRNRGDGTFEDVSDLAGEWIAHSEVSRGAATGDLDNDGDHDLLVTNNSGPARLFENRVGGSVAWLGVRPLSSPGGAVRLQTAVGVSPPGGESRWLRARADSSYASASDPRVLFGLGARPDVGEVMIRWPSGRTLRILEPPTNTYLVISERR